MKRGVVQRRALPAVERIAKILGDLQRGERLNCSTAAEEFEVTTKTIQRDLEFMRYRFDIDMEYDHSQRTFRLLSAPSNVVAFLRLMATETINTRRRVAVWMNN
ncbi:hypothetical protein DB345_12355 [Spartobacteria bacterium LR76]|nr:hypothetical protein DB345_12355 [Spartobacteria bacterium LR76]